MVRSSFNYKQIIILRTDLNMSVGKMISQACHACLASSNIVRNINIKIWNYWHKEGAKKVILQVNSKKDLLKLEKTAKKFKIPSYSVKDRGLTEIPPDTFTALAIGPALNEDVDKITSHLKLL